MANNSRKKLLLVDDAEVHLEIAEFQLKKEYEITCARSGKEALEHLTNGLVPNLIILDILMPDMDGWETFGRLKAISLLHAVPIIFLSSVTEKDEMDRAYNMGAAGFITKPYEEEELLGMVRKVLDEKL